MLKRLWLDEGGAVLSVELILILVILVFGVGVGLVALRDAVDAKLCDVADAIANLNTGYTYTGITYTSPIDGVDLSLTATTTYTTLTPLVFDPTKVMSSTP